MEYFPDETVALSEQGTLAMLEDTSQLIAQHSASQLSSTALAAQGSTALTNQVEFWQWMARNYHKSGIFDSSASMQAYMSQGAGKVEWLSKQLQGKGYEWDWMTAQRVGFRNIFKIYDAGDVVNRAASDVTERSLLTGRTMDYQMKASAGKGTPKLKNTPKEMTVVTSAEKTGAVRRKGFHDVREFQDASTIKETTAERLEQAQTGTAQTAYTFRNVSATMAKAGIVGFAVGVGTETITSYRAWKQGQLSDEGYLRSVLCAGGDAGVTSGATAGILVPVSAAVTKVGASSLLTIPVAFVVSAAVNQVVAPAFGRGRYREILSKAQYYRNLDAVYGDLIASMQIASEEYYGFICQMSQQAQNHQTLRAINAELDRGLESLLDSI